MKPSSIVAGVSVLIVIILAWGGMYLYKHRGAANDQHGGGAPPAFVDVAIAKDEPFQPTGRLVGTVIGKRMVTVKNEVVGLITNVGFSSGDTVEAGHVLVTLDATTELADLAAAQAAERVAGSAIESAQANVRVAETDVEWANANYERYKDARASVSLADVDKARTDLDRANAMLMRSKSAVEQARAEAEREAAHVAQLQTIIDKKTIKSPFRARVGMRNVHEGQYLAEGSDIVGLTELTEDIYVDFAVPQEYVGFVVPGTTVTAKSNIIGRGDQNTAPISVLSMDATVNPVTRNVRVRTSVPNPGFVLKPGMAVDVQVPIGPPQPSVTVPATAVRRGAFGDHVFVLKDFPPPPPAWAQKKEEKKDDHKKDAPPADAKKGDAPAQQGPPPKFAHLRMVTLGTNLGDRIVITKGVEPGDLVAASGSFKLMDGTMVFEDPKSKGPPANGAPAPAAPGSAPATSPGGDGAPAAAAH